MRLLIWDFDGTLGYREGGWSGALQEVLEANGLARGMSRSDLTSHLRSGFPWHTPDEPRETTSADAWWERLEPIFAGAFAGVGVEKAVALTLATEVRTAYLATPRWRLFPDTVEALGQLSSGGWQHALLTNHVPELPLILAHLGLENRFIGVFNSAEMGVEKPHARAFSNVLEALEPETARMIGDNLVADIAGAEAVGIPAILVRNPDPSVTSFCTDLTEVVRVLGLA